MVLSWPLLETYRRMCQNPLIELLWDTPTIQQNSQSKLFQIKRIIDLTTLSLSVGGFPGCPGASTFSKASPSAELGPHGW